MKRYLKFAWAAFLVLALSACGGNGSENDPVLKDLATPTDVRLNRQTDHSLIFQWETVSGADNYHWKLLQGDTQVQEGTTRNTNAIVDALTKGVKYRFAVQALSGSSASAWSAYVEATPGGEVAEDDPEDGEDDSKEDDEKSAVSDAVYAQFLIPAAEEDGVARAFPGAEGGGMFTSGGRGGIVYHVTNLNDNGPGSLRYGLGLSGPRTIVFDVAGIIELRSTLNITKGDVTIAGQTAPGDGICLKNYTFRISASNVIVRFIRCRMGDEAQTEDDAMQVLNHKDDSYSHIIIDHCSVSWSTDECASFYGMKHFTFQWNIVSESLRNSVHEKGNHGYGGIWGGNDASYHHNLLAHHDSRNPRIDHDYVSTQKGPVSIVNNVVYNWNGNTCYGGESSSETAGGYRKYNFFNNYYKPGPATPSNHIWFLQPTVSCSNCTGSFGGTVVPGHFYMTGNYMYGQNALSENNWKSGTKAPVGVYFSESVTAIKAGSPFSYSEQPSSLTIHSAEAALEPVLSYAGASLKRDEIDGRIARETRDGSYTYKGSNGSTGGLIDTQSDVGGWPAYGFSEADLSADSDQDGMPDWFEDTFGLNKDSDKDAQEIWLDKNARYTNLEMYLQYLVRDIVTGQNKGGQYQQL